MIRKERYISNPGDKNKIIYSPVISKDGTLRLEQSGVEDLDAYIQSQVPMTDLSVILSRVANGDMEALNQTRGMYGDFTELPKTFAELLQLQIDAHSIYDKLTNEQKKEFDFDFNKFFADAGSEEWLCKVYGKKKEIDIIPSDDEKAVTE